MPTQRSENAVPARINQRGERLFFAQASAAIRIEQQAARLLRAHAWNLCEIPRIYLGSYQST
jgi:hypothetical protein